MGNGFRGSNGQPAAPPYTHGPYTFSEHITFQGGAEGAGFLQKDSQVWYVDRNKSPSVSGTGLSPEEAFLTLTEAIAAAGNFDVIYVSFGYYQEAATVTITQHGLRIFGTAHGGVLTTNGFSSATSGDHILKINAESVEIAGVAFFALTNAKDAIIIGEGYAASDVWIHDCSFSAGTAENEFGEYGIKLNDDTNNVVGTLIENCYFFYLSTAAIVVDATRTTIRNNLIWTNAIGIDLQGEAGARPCSAVLNNTIIGRAGGTGIKIAATEPTDGTIVVADNSVANCAVNITPSKGDAGLINNGTYRDGDDFGQVDPTG